MYFDSLPFGAKAPLDDMVQVWAIPPLSRGLLYRRHQQYTTMPETNEASSVSLPKPTTF